MKGFDSITKVSFFSAMGVFLYGLTLFIIFTNFFSHQNMRWLSSVALEKYEEVVGDREELPFLAVKGTSRNDTQASTYLEDGHESKSSTTSMTEEDSEEEGSTSKKQINFQEYVNPAVHSSINLRYDGRIHKIDSSEIRMILGHNQFLGDAKDTFKQGGEPLIKTIVSEEFEPYNYDKKIIQKNEDGILQEKLRGFEYYESDYGPDIDDTVSEVVRIIQMRLDLNYGNQDYITVKNFDHFGTNGEYSNDKYIEMDHSKQMIYAWEGGELYKKWDSSGFYDEYAVFGVFDIKNKSPKAWSPIAEKWMPYWMAFYYEKKQAAWFGLHELVWWYDADGSIIEESSDSIGFKKSGGCVRLDRGEMIELYDWTDVGIHFLIHQ